MPAASPAAPPPRQQQHQQRRRRVRPRPIAIAITAAAAALASLLPSAAAAAAYQQSPRTLTPVGRAHRLPTVRPMTPACHHHYQHQHQQQQQERRRRIETWQRRGMVAVAAAADGGDGQQPQQQEGPDDLDDDTFGGSGLSTREALITGLGINPLTILLALAAIGMAGANALYGPGWLRPSLGMKPTTFQSRNLVLPLDQEGMLFPLGEEGKGNVWREWERD